MSPTSRESDAVEGLHEAIPKLMEAAAIDRFGGPEVLTLHTLPVPEHDPDEVLIAMHTAGVGPWDAEIRRGSYDGTPHFPMILGIDGSGHVAATGSRVRRLKVGDLVYASSYDNPKGGFYAEFVAVPADRVGRVPEWLDLKKAGAIATTGITALQGIDDALQVKKGEYVIVHGATGGVGSLAVQFAKLRGAHVMGTATTDAGADFVHRIGADVAINDNRRDIAEAARAFAPKGVDAVLGLVGGPTLEKCLDAMREGGRLAYPNGVEPEPEPREGVTIVAYDGIPGPREFDRLARAVKESNAVIEIAAEYPLAEASRAHEHIEKKHVIGKIILRIASD